MQDAAEGDKGRAGLMGAVTQNKEPAAQPAAGPTSQPKPGRFANLRAKLARPSEHVEASSPVICAP